jgi:PEP-CTERM motif
MRERVLRLLGIVAMVLGVASFVAPSASQAVTITSVSVTVGGTTWCGDAAVAACGPNDIWAIPVGGITLTGTQSLLLAQTSGFNFDSSEGNAPACAAGTPCATTITINGLLVYSNASSVLANGNIDPGGIVHNEAANYVAAGGVAGSYTLSIGYADNVHTNACADVDGNCFPDPFTGDFVFAAGTVLPAGFVETQINHCTGPSDCYDSGVLRIVSVPGTQVPAASTLLLLGTGLIGVAAWSRRRLQGKN